MGVLGIITCQILELELAHLLATDADLAGVTVLEDPCSTRLIELLESRGGRNLHLIPHLASLAPEPSGRPEAVVLVLPLGLHRSRSVLQRVVPSAARELSRHVDALILGYGLCGSAFADPEELLDVGIPVFIPMDQDHPADDCVGMLLGGHACYYAEQCKTPGTFFMTPGWAAHWEEIFEGTDGGAEAAKRMFAGYERALLVVTSVMGEEEMRGRVAGFTKLLGLRVESRQGTLEPLIRTWNLAKMSLQAAAGTFAGE